MSEEQRRKAAQEIERQKDSPSPPTPGTSLPCLTSAISALCVICCSFSFFIYLYSVLHMCQVQAAFEQRKKEAEERRLVR